MVLIFNMTTDVLKEKNAIHTAGEIYQQPDVWQETMDMIGPNYESFRTFVQDIFTKHEQVQVMLTGAGTSAFAGDTLAPELNKQTPGHVHFVAVPTTDIVSNPKEYLFPDVPTIMVSFARSGNSPESLATVSLAEEIINDFYQVVITCNKDGQLAKNIQEDANSITLLMPEKSNDQSLAMTSSFTCMVLAAYALFSKKPLANKTLQQLTQNARRLLDSVTETIDDILAFPFERVVYLGSGILSELAHEASLKMLELTGGKVVAMHESSLGFRHGPKSVINEQSIIVVFVSQDSYTRKYDIDILREVAADDSGMKVIALTETYDEEVAALADWLIPVRSTNEALKSDLYLALLDIIFAQTFAMKKSLDLGLTPDNPSPDGVINRVVKGVTIHPFNA